MRLCLAALLAFATTLYAAAPKQLEGAYTFKKNGWTYVHLQGPPDQVGFQHGYLLSAEIEDNYHVYRLEQEHNSGRDGRGDGQGNGLGLGREDELYRARRASLRR